MRRQLSLALPILAAMLAGLPGTSRADFAHLTFQSQAGDFIGGGQTVDHIYTPANSQSFFIEINQTLPNGSPTYISFILGTVTSDNTNTYTSLNFSTAKLGTALQPGTYLDAQRAAFADPGHPGLDVSYQNRGSNTLTGSFTINSVSFFKDTTGTLQIGEFDANFVQHSEGKTPALIGHFVFESSAVPEPTSVALLGLGSAGLVCFARRRLARSTR